MSSIGALHALLVHPDPDVRAQGEALAASLPEADALTARGAAAIDRIFEEVEQGALWLVLPPSMLHAVLCVMPDADPRGHIRRDGASLHVGPCVVSADVRVTDITWWSAEADAAAVASSPEDWSFLM
ncbi:MAG: hypothetical protein AAFV53_03835 [Myxococcota bacterium]